MGVIQAEEPAPEFTLRRADGSDFTRADLDGQTTVLVFYPFAFSPTCTDQFQVYEEVIDELTARDATLYGVSTDSTYSQAAFKERVGVSIEQLSDFEPKGAASKAFGVYFEPAGMSTRALVIVAADLTIQWSWEGEHPGVMPGANLIFDGLAQATA